MASNNVAINAPAPHGHSPPGPGHERSGQVSSTPTPKTTSVQLKAHGSAGFCSGRRGQFTSHQCSGLSPADTTAATAAEAAR
ncbi:hypothetical protein [Hymenobacter agri]